MSFSIHYTELVEAVSPGWIIYSHCEEFPFKWSDLFQIIFKHLLDSDIHCRFSEGLMQKKDFKHLKKIEEDFKKSSS